MKRLSATAWYAFVFGLFLGLCIWKFGNPVILDQKIIAPVTAADYLNDTWPIHWAGWLLLPLAVAGLILIVKNPWSWPTTRWLGLLPLGWLAWQFLAAGSSVDAELTTATLWQFGGCAACYFLGVVLFARAQGWRWLLPGLFAALIFCLVRAINQHVFEFPENYQMLVQGEANGWTNFPAANVAEMKTEGIIITTNGLDVANPVILAKFLKGRVSGTLVYPNALAQLILLLWPLAFTLALTATQKLKPLIRYAAIGMTAFLGGLAFFWTGSKLGWLIAMGIVGLYLLRRNWSPKLKLTAVALVIVLGLGVFAVRFHDYLSAGATSVSARFDYWHAAAQTAADRPVFGTGPGTFQRPYARLKSPAAEMARLTHNDYLEQFSDSGCPAGLAYTGWIILALLVAGRKVWSAADPALFAVFAGVLAWFVQGLGEFGLYVPALAWIAFALLGSLVGMVESALSAEKTVGR